MKTIDRKTILGGSDAAAVLGLSPWRTCLQVWREKTGRDPGNDDDPDSRRRKARGHKLEPFIRDMTIEKLESLGHRVKLVRKNRRYFDKANPFLSAEIDFELELDGELVPVDAKSVDGRARFRWGEVGTDEIPIEYAAQFVHGLGLHPAKPQRTLVAALRSFDDVDLYVQKRDDVTFEAMRERMVRFWVDHVQKDVAPEPVNLADVRAMFPRARPATIKASDEIVEIVEKLRKTKSQIKDLERQEQNLRFFIGRFMGDHAALTQGARDLMTWEVEERVQFEMDRFKVEHPDWYALYCKTNEVRTLRFGRARG